MTRDCVSRPHRAIIACLGKTADSAMSAAGPLKPVFMSPKSRQDQALICGQDLGL